MIDAKKISEMANCMRSLLKELAALEKSRIKSGDWEASKPSRSRASETARESAIDIRRLTHEAHCIAVELGIADRRSDSHYQASTAPAGFGRSFILDRRAPLAPDSDPWHTAVLEQCMLTEACYQEADPAGTVKALIDWHVANGAAVQAVGAWPAELPLRIQVSYSPGDWDTFAYGVSGHLSMDVLTEIEAAIRGEDSEALFDLGPGDYLLSASHFSGQYGPEGRCEWAPCWEFDIEGFRPPAVDPAADAEEPKL